MKNYLKKFHSDNYRERLKEEEKIIELTSSSKAPAPSEGGSSCISVIDVLYDLTPDKTKHYCSHALKHLSCFRCDGDRRLINYKKKVTTGETSKVTIVRKRKKSGEIVEATFCQRQGSNLSCIWYFLNFSFIYLDDI